MVAPMRAELTNIGAEELMTPDAVDAWVGDASKPGLLVINSICGCAAGMARPGVALAMQNAVRPERFATVFAGQDKEATARAREHITGMPPSSPSVALFKDGKLADFLPRGRIEGRSAEDVRADLVAMFERHLAS
ncbi:MAG: BrxA/BrxB family bacilliredoxin [Planctomycetes bacterium]|nr:BrxA/BrxB family bacilliredoxin [Planctomycetota bacterium]